MDSTTSEDSTMEIVMKNIYTSCDPDNSNMVTVSKLIEFITPYMLEDLSALESLRSSLDPENKNVCVSSEKFYEVMNEWTKKITNSSDEDSDFNTTPSVLEVIDDKQLPYIQSTPRASFGQKLLSCEGLLNLSNVSGYSLSTSTQTKDNSFAGQEKTVLEDEIKRLEHHLSKLSNEMAMVKLQLTTAEEQNETLQADLDRCKTRLHSEQQIIEHLQNDKRYNEELRDELNCTKKQVEELNKKLLQYEKDNQHLANDIKQTEKENSKLEEKCEELLRREQAAKKEIINIKTELDLKDQEIMTILKINDELKSKLNQQRDVIDQLTNENELLEHQKNNIEKALRDNLSAKRDSLVHQFKTCLADSSSFPDIDPGSEDESYFKMQAADFKNLTQNSLHEEISQVVQNSNIPYNSLLSFEKNEKLLELEENSNHLTYLIESYKDEISQLNIKNDSIQTTLETADQENHRLCQQISDMKDKMSILQKDLNNLLIEKKDQEANMDQIKDDNDKIQNEVKKLNQRIGELTDQNNNLSVKEKSLCDTLESKIKIITELEQNLTELKKEFSNIQIDNVAKEKELSAKFNFETAYKKLQMELNERNEEVAALSNTKEELEKCLTKLMASKQDLESALKQARADLKDHKEQSKKMMSLNENITLTATQVQVHLDRKNVMINELVELNKRFENNIAKLEEDLQNKIMEVSKLKSTLEDDVRVKNIMWRDNKELKSQLDAEVEKKEKLIDEIKELKEKHENEYNELLSNYNKEAEKNCELCHQIYTYKTDLTSSINKYNDEVDKNRKLYEQFSALKTDIDTIRESQQEYKVKIDKKLTDYEDLINRLEKKLQDAESENNELKTTLEKKKSKPFDIELNLSESGKNSRSFEKQKLAIDRLKEKLENMQDQLQREKTKREVLEQYLKEKDDTEDKYTKRILDLEQAQCYNLLEKQELQTTIIDLTSKIKIHEKRCVELENKLRETEESLALKLSQLEQQNQHLYMELRNNEIIIKNACLEIETYKNLFKNADQKAQELSNTISVYLLECNNKQKEIKLIKAELADRDNKIVSLSSKIEDQDMELKSVLNELTEKKNINLTLEKENKLLQEMLSKSDDSKEKELLHIEEKLKNTRMLLQCSEMELSLVEKKLSDSREEHEKMCNNITKCEDVITKGKTELSRASNLVLNKWNEILERETIYRELMLLKDSEPSEKEDEISSLDNKIKIAVLLLELLASKSPISMEGTDFGINSLLNTKSTTNQYSQSDVKMIKKFTLRPSRLHVSRPVSPDSPSVDIEGTNVETPQAINFNTSKEIYISPDSHISQTCPGVSDDSYETAGDELSLTKDNIEFTSFQDTFPNITDTFLEKLGLREDCTKQNLSKDETEKVFATFAIQIALDSRDIKDRLQKQKDRCVQHHEKFLSLIRDISNRLRDHKCIGAADPISPVFVLLEDVKFLLRDLTQSAEQFGLLTCENRMMKCWNLVTNYMAFLKQDVVILGTPKVTEESDNQAGTIASFGAKFRKRLQNLNGKDDVNCSSSVSSSQNAVTDKRRYKCTAVKNSLVLIVFIIIFVSIFFVSIHWQCRMTAHENQVCVLDDFIKKIQIGNPPY